MGLVQGQTVQHKMIVINEVLKFSTWTALLKNAFTVIIFIGYMWTGSNSAKKKKTKKKTNKPKKIVDKQLQKCGPGPHFYILF